MSTPNDQDTREFRLEVLTRALLGACAVTGIVGCLAVELLGHRCPPALVALAAAAVGGLAAAVRPPRQKNGS